MTNAILIVEDDLGLQKYLSEILLDNGYSVRTATTGVEAMQRMEELSPDLVILDLGLPQVTGESVCLELRKTYPDLPVVILTARDSVSDVIKGLNLGADDYITKPFVVEELLARIKAQLRRRDGVDSKIKVNDLELNTNALEVRRDGKLLQLTPQEFKLLHYLITNRGRVLTREMILNRVWLYSPDVETRVVDVYIGYLRKKIDRDFDKKLIHSVRGFGYMVKE